MPLLPKKIRFSPRKIQAANPRLHIDVVHYTSETIDIKQDVNLKEALVFKEKPGMTWINIRGIHDSSVVQSIGNYFKLHPLILEDLQNSGQRSKLGDFKENIYFVLRILTTQNDQILDEQASIVLGKDYLISFLEGDKDIFEPIRLRLKNTDSNNQIRKHGTDYLAYTLIDAIVDNYFIILEHVDQQLGDLEEALINNTDSRILYTIQQTKRQIISLRKSVWPMREVISHFRRLDSPLIEEPTKLYIQDVYDHTIQAIDTIESFRDITSGMFDIYLSNINLRMNEIMKVLTIVATIFVPITFIASVYGMNFDKIPGLHSNFGFVIACAVMGGIALGMLAIFRHIKWI